MVAKSFPVKIIFLNILSSRFLQVGKFSSLKKNNFEIGKLENIFSCQDYFFKYFLIKIIFLKK